MSSIATLLALLLINGIVTSSLAETYDCTIEKDGEKEICVFRNVEYFKNTTHIAFSSPGPTKPENVAFKDSNMVAIPPNFLLTFGNDLKFLIVENCMLQTVTITKNMEVLYAKNNYIEKVLMSRNTQCDNLKELDLSSNRLGNAGNITNCKHLITLNLSGNEGIWEDDTVDLSLFESMIQLRDLNLAGTGVFYIDNSKNIGLPSLQTIDLSKNDILPADFNIEIFYPFHALETLKLNDNGMTSIDYAFLLNIKTLKSVYLNGNSFPCLKIKVMRDFLQAHNIATPTDRHSNCQQNAREIEGMCCTGPMPTSIPRPSSPSVPGETVSTGTPTSKPRPTLPSGVPGESDATPDYRTNNDANENGTSHHWIIAVVLIVIVVAAGAAGVCWYKKRQRS